MSLPQSFFEDLMSHYGFSLKSLQDAASSLSNLYRQKKPLERPSLSNAERLSYCFTRFPATYEVIREVFTHLPKTQTVESFLDLGCGPGTATKAALDCFESLQHVCLVDHDKQMLDLANFILLKTTALKEASYLKQSLTNLDVKGSYDLVVLPYVLGEISPKERETVLAKALEKTSKALVIITPGRPFDKEYLLKARTYLLKKKMFCYAPCHHGFDCPLENTSNWCHFSKRLARNSFHRYLKQGDLGYEDEKYSYLIFTKESHEREPFKRLIGPIYQQKGAVELSLCTAKGQWDRDVIKKSAPLYKVFKKKKWGETI